MSLNGEFKVTTNQGIIASTVFLLLFIIMLVWTADLRKSRDSFKAQSEQYNAIMKSQQKLLEDIKLKIERERIAYQLQIDSLISTNSNLEDIIEQNKKRIKDIEFKYITIYEEINSTPDSLQFNLTAILVARNKELYEQIKSR